jgi:hypothetical protein
MLHGCFARGLRSPVSVSCRAICILIVIAAKHSPQDITVLAGPVSVGAEPAHAPHVEFQSPIAQWIRWAWRSSSAGGRIGSGVMKAPSMPKAVQREENLAQASAPEEPGARLVPEQPADDPDGMPLPSPPHRFPRRLVLAGTPCSILCGAGDRPAHRARLHPHACSATSLANAGAPFACRGRSPPFS